MKETFDVPLDTVILAVENGSSQSYDPINAAAEGQSHSWSCSFKFIALKKSRKTVFSAF